MNLIVKLGGTYYLIWLCGCANILDQDAALATTPYYIEDSGRIVIEATVNGRGPFEFALDTATSISVIFDELQRLLDIEPLEGQEVIIHGAVASKRFPLIRAERISVGPEAWTGPRIAAMPRTAETGSSIDEILGIDFLRRYAVGFSNQNRVVRLYAPDLLRHESYRGWSAIPLSPRRVGTTNASLYFFDIGIRRRQIRSVFDLGAGLNILNWHAAKSFGATPISDRAQVDKSIIGVIKSTREVAAFEAEAVTTGTVKWHNETFSIADLAIFETLALSAGPAAIVGAGMFTQRDFVIDFVRNRLLVNVAGVEADRVDQP